MPEVDMPNILVLGHLYELLMAGTLLRHILELASYH
jgi:hypothetical protein